MKQLKITLVLIFFIGIFQNVFSQQIKTYQGPFKNGNSTYQYYDTDEGRIYQGPFKYTEEGITITGQYDKNKRSGQWITSKVDKNNINGKVQKKEILTGHYSNDLMEGLWTIERTDLENNKTLLSSQANFKDGYLIGMFKYYNSNTGFILNNIEQINELSLIGNFDNNGNFDSIWIANYKVNKIPFEFNRKFKKGLLFFELKRNLSTGEIISKYDNPTTPVKFPHFESSFEYSIKFVTCINNYPNELYSQVLNIWECIKTPNTYELEKLNSYIDLNNLEHTNVLVGGLYNPEDYIDPRIETKKQTDQINKLKLNSIISKADSLFNNKKYDAAEVYYLQAEGYPYEHTPYIDSQLKKIENLRNQQDPVIQDQQKTQKEAEENKNPKYKRIINVFKNK